MQLKVVLPHQIFLEETGVQRIVIETRLGAFGILPRRLDCAAPLAAGILVYETKQGEQYLAVGAGLLTKVGRNVSVAVSRAMRSDDLKSLRQQAQLEFSKEDEKQKDVRAAVARLEHAFMRHFLELKHYV